MFFSDQHNYAVFTDTWQGIVRYQGYYLIGDPLPVAEPQFTREDATLDCWQDAANKRIPALIDPSIRRFDWSGENSRRNL